MPDPLDTDLLPDEETRVPLKVAVVSGEDAGAELTLTDASYRIGHGQENDLVLHDAAVSRVHLLVEVIDKRVTLADAGSTNGSFCNGVRFERIAGQAGTVVCIGTTELQLIPVSARVSALPPSDREQFGGLVGRTLKMRELFTLLERIAASDVDVLIQGETGTGKEVCAEAIHSTSRRAVGPFVICDLATVAPSLIESELFGHAKGAFTGALSARTGMFEAANGGTLFLDEIGDLPLDVQPRLLRALERRQVKRVGTNTFTRVDVRVIAATHRDLKEEVKAGRFREDLYYRLVVAIVRLPPLRERPSDISMIVDTILQSLGQPATRLGAEARRLLYGYPWPGNVRELRHAVMRLVSLGGDVDLSEAGAGDERAATAALSFKDAKERIVGAFERDYLTDLMRRHSGSVAEAAKEAGIHRVHLRRLLKKHGCDAKPGTDDE